MDPVKLTSAERDPKASVLAVDVGGIVVKSAIVHGRGFEVRSEATMTDTDPWNVEKLQRIGVALYERSLAAGHHPEVLSVAVPGQVDEVHGVVQYSANLPWHDVGVADALRAVLPVEVLVRHDVRAAALAESNFGAGVGVAMLYVSIGSGIGAAGAHEGTVVADRAGAGAIGQIRIRSGPGSGLRLEEFASAPAIARRYCERSGAEPRSSSALDVHARIKTDQVARLVWSDTIDALADALEWAVTLFSPTVLVIGGGLVNAGEDLLTPLREALARHFESVHVPQVRGAAFGDGSGWVGAALVGWRQLHRPPEDFAMALSTPAEGDDPQRH